MTRIASTDSCLSSCWAQRRADQQRTVSDDCRMTSLTGLWLLTPLYEQCSPYRPALQSEACSTGLQGPVGDQSSARSPRTRQTGWPSCQVLIHSPQRDLQPGNASSEVSVTVRSSPERRLGAVTRQGSRLSLGRARPGQCFCELSQRRCTLLRGPVALALIDATLHPKPQQLPEALPDLSTISWTERSAVCQVSSLRSVHCKMVLDKSLRGVQ